MKKTNQSGKSETLQDLVTKVQIAGWSQKEMERRLSCSAGYLASRIVAERKGKIISSLFIAKFKAAFELELTGTKTISLDESEILRNLIEENIHLRAALNVLMMELAVLLDPKNASQKFQSLTTTAREAAEQQLSAVKS